MGVPRWQEQEMLLASGPSPMLRDMASPPVQYTYGSFPGHEILQKAEKS